MQTFKIDMKSTVTDSITGFTGVVTGRCEYITGCRQYLVAPKCKEDGEPVDARWFDEDRILAKMPDTPQNNGGPHSSPPPTK